MRPLGAILVVLGGLLALARKAMGNVLPLSEPDPDTLRPAPLRSVEIAVEPHPAVTSDTEPEPWETSAAAQAWLPTFRNAENRYGIPHGLLSRVAYEESRFRVDARSPAGALGIMQFLPTTAQDLGVDPFDPRSAIDGAGRYLQYLRGLTDSWGEALAAYNWGIGNVQSKGLESAPAETRRYVAAILGDVPADRDFAGA